MATLAVVNVSRLGANLAGVAASAGGDSFPNSGKEILVVTNSHPNGYRDVTLVTAATVDGNAVADPVVSVGPNSRVAIGPFQRWAYGTTVSVTYSSAADVTVAVLRVTAETI